MSEFSTEVEALIAPLPRRWRWLFRVEIPLVVVTLALWLFQPISYLRDTVGIAAPGEPEVYLLRLYAGTVGSLVLGFYAWLLWQSEVHLPTFRAFQVWLGIGDLIIVIVSVAYWPSNPSQTMSIAQIAMAVFWGLVRVVFLIRTRTATHPAQS